MDKTLVEYLEKRGFHRSVFGPISEHSGLIERGVIEMYIKKLKDGNKRFYYCSRERLVEENTKNYSEPGFKGVYCIYTRE